LATGILILPQRHPIYVAKEVATLDVLSGGRAILGIGIGWLKEEFDALGIPFAERAARTRESVAAIRSLWKETPEAFAGKFFRWGPLESDPKPVQKAGGPIVVGGHGEWAARRAARYGDGFFPAVGEPEKLRALFGVLREECGRIGRKPEEIELSAGRGRPDLDGVRRLQDLGVSRITMGPPGFDKEDVTRGLHDFAERVSAQPTAGSWRCCARPTTPSRASPAIPSPPTTSRWKASASTTWTKDRATPRPCSSCTASRRGRTSTGR